MTTTQTAAESRQVGIESLDVLQLLRVQASLYARLESLASHQRTLVTGDDPDLSGLLSLLADRQKLSDQMARVGERLEPVRRDWSKFRDSLGPSDRQEAERLLGETQERLRRMIEGDEHDARVLSVRKEAVARTLRATHTSGQAVSAYRTSGSNTGRLDCVDGDGS